VGRIPPARPIEEETMREILLVILGALVALVGLSYKKGRSIEEETMREILLVILGALIALVGLSEKKGR
jgi:hypothetical protein